MKKTIFLVMFLLSLSLVQASPNVDLQLAKQDPLPATPGETVEVFVNVYNTGNDARNLEIEFKDNNVFTLLNENNRVVNVPVLGSFKDQQIRYLVYVNDEAPTNANIELSYSMQNSDVNVNKFIPIRIGDELPVVTIASTTSTPSTPSPGEEFVWTINVRNDASNSIRDVKLTLDVEEVISGQAVVRNLPFIPMSGTNEKNLNIIVPQQTASFSFNMIVDPSARTNVYKVPAILSYTDINGNVREESFVLGKQVNSEPELHLAIDSSNVNTNNRQGDVTFIVTNSGLADIKLASIEILPGESYEIVSSNNRVYLGNIESDDFDTARFTLKTSEDRPTYNVRLHFRDSMNTQFTHEYEITHNLREGSSSGGLGFTTIIIVLAVIAGIYYYRKKKKKQSDE